ncbi:MAG: hypothetical protein ACE5K3_01345 [bacterium]
MTTQLIKAASRKKTQILLVVITVSSLTLLIPWPGQAADYLHITDSGFVGLPISVRAVGMGGTFVAIADDYGACHFNPAGLVQIRQRELGTMHADLYSLGLLHHYFLSFVEPSTGMGAGGISWSRLSADLEPEKWNYDLIFYSYGQFLSTAQPSLKEIFSSWGVNIKYLKQTTTWEEASGYGLDAAFFIRRRKFSCGTKVENLISQVKWGTGRRESIPLTVKLGTAYRFSPRGLLALDIGASREDFPREIRLGGEWWPIKALGVRLGVVKIFQKFADFRITAGLGFHIPIGKKVGRVELNYAFSYNQDLRDTHRFSLSYSF